MTWQPIETAPRDGNWVLVFGPHGVDKAQFCKWTYDTSWERVPTAEYDNEWATVAAPTHWMPLPAPPERPNA